MGAVIVNVDEEYVVPAQDEGTLADLMGVLRDFSRNRVAPLSEVPETKKDQAQFDAVLEQLGQMGLLSDGADEGLLWGDPGDSEQVLFSAQALAQLATGSSTLAFQAHLRALAAALAPVGVDAATLALSLNAGAVGAARATGRAFADAVSPGDEPFLADLWGAPTAAHQRLIFSDGRWENVLWPCWDAQGWTWRVSSRAEVTSTEQANPHGFDEMVVHEWHLSPTGASAAPTVEARAEVTDALALQGIALLAIALGALTRAGDQAREHSLIRFQGGKIIAEHDAISRLLSDGAQAVSLTTTTLPELSQGSGLERLVRVWRARASLHPILCTGGTNALQSFGGIGYMRDLGVEKEVRALNTLRRLDGAPPELILRCAGVDESAHRKARA